MLYINQKGNVGYVIVGSPSIVDGILENPNRKNYIKTDTTFQDTGEDFRLHVEFLRTGSGTVPVLGTNQTGGARPLLALDTSKPRFRIGTGVNIYGVQSLWRTNTPYAIDVSRTGNIWTLKSFMNGNQVDIQTLESSALLNDGAAFTWVFGCDFAVYGDGITGNIDLNKTYINYDKEAWFGVSPMEVKKHQIMGPNGYTVVGSPTITDGVMSDISNDNYAYTLTNSTMYQRIVSFETVIKFTTGTSAPTGNLFGWQNGHGGAYINNWHKIRCVAIDFSAKKYNDYLTHFPVLQANKTYYFKYEFKNNQGSCSFKEEGGEWQTEQIETGTNNFNNPSNYNYFYGRSNLASGYLTGGASIDFNETYIKVNGKLWFWQPQETKRIVVNGVEVWTKPE